MIAIYLYLYHKVKLVKENYIYENIHSISIQLILELYFSVNRDNHSSTAKLQYSLIVCVQTNWFKLFLA
jgi:hypothetical protein